MIVFHSIFIGHNQIYLQMNERREILAGPHTDLLPYEYDQALDRLFLYQLCSVHVRNYWLVY